MLDKGYSESESDGRSDSASTSSSNDYESDDAFMLHNEITLLAKMKMRYLILERCRRSSKAIARAINLDNLDVNRKIKN